MKAAPWIGLVVLVISVIGYFGHGYLVERDFRQMCEIHREALENPGEKGSAEIAYEIADRIEKTMLTSSPRATFRAVSVAAANEKYHLIQQSAAESGVTGWTCPEMEAYMKPNSL